MRAGHEHLRHVRRAAVPAAAALVAVELRDGPAVFCVGARATLQTRSSWGFVRWRQSRDYSLRTVVVFTVCLGVVECLVGGFVLGAVDTTITLFRVLTLNVWIHNLYISSIRPFLLPSRAIFARRLREVTRVRTRCAHLSYLLPFPVHLNAHDSVNKVRAHPNRVELNATNGITAPILAAPTGKRQPVHLQRITQLIRTTEAASNTTKIKPTIFQSLLTTKIAKLPPMTVTNRQQVSHVIVESTSQRTRTRVPDT